MKADLARREPAQLAAWERCDLEAAIRARARRAARSSSSTTARPTPTATSTSATALNKILKDVVVRSRTMMGFDAPYVPGWDCHGLPIEQQVDKKLGSKKREMDAVAIRQACREYAAGVHRHPARGVPAARRRRQLGASVPDDELRRTRPRSRARSASFYAKDLVYQALKSVRWCFTDRTALAEAELEYEERTDPAIYVAFPIPGDLAIRDRSLGPDEAFS